MRGDFADLRPSPTALPTDKGEFCVCLLQALGTGSSWISPFSHTSWSLQKARKRQQLGRSVREDEGKHLVHINVSALRPEQVIDLSTLERQPPHLLFTCSPLTHLHQPTATSRLPASPPPTPPSQQRF